MSHEPESSIAASLSRPSSSSSAAAPPPAGSGPPRGSTRKRQATETPVGHAPSDEQASGGGTSGSDHESCDGMSNSSSLFHDPMALDGQVGLDAEAMLLQNASSSAAVPDGEDAPVDATVCFYAGSLHRSTCAMAEILNPAKFELPSVLNAKARSSSRAAASYAVHRTLNLRGER